MANLANEFALKTTRPANDCIASAERHVMLFRPNVVIIDLGLPDGNGIEVAKIVEEKCNTKPGLLILSAAEEDVAIKAVEESGADGYLMKPIESLGAFQEAILSVLPGTAKNGPDWNAEFSADMSHSDFYEQDLENVLDLLEEAVRDDNQAELAFAAQFLSGAASTVGDAELAECAKRLSTRLSEGHKGIAAAGSTIATVGSRLTGVISQAG